jgi:hypothetical protein
MSTTEGVGIRINAISQAVRMLALQLHFCLEMGAARFGLVSSSPE